MPKIEELELGELRELERTVYDLVQTYGEDVTLDDLYNIILEEIDKRIETKGVKQP